MKQKTEVVATLEQMQVLGSETRLRLLHYFTEGDFSEAEVAERLGVAPQSLYYHIRILLRVGLVQQVGTRHTAKKPQAVYSAVAQSIVLKPDYGAPEQRLAVVQNIQAFLRIASREVESAMLEGDATRADLCFISRQRLKLTPETAKRFEADLEKLIERYSESETGTETVCFTAVAAPRLLPERKAEQN